MPPRKPPSPQVGAATDDRRSPHALDLDNYIPAYLAFVSNKLSSGASAVYRKQFGIGIVDWRVMATLAIEPWVLAGRICELNGIDRAAASRSLKMLQSKGLVETRQQDGNLRRQYLALTRKGIELHDRVVKVAHQREEQLLAGFTPAERAQAIGFLLRMHAQLPRLERT
jgi:DNA-binding MarR family transcriptional regulator